MARVDLQTDDWLPFDHACKNVFGKPRYRSRHRAAAFPITASALSCDTTRIVEFGSALRAVTSRSPYPGVPDAAGSPQTTNRNSVPFASDLNSRSGRFTSFKSPAHAIYRPRLACELMAGGADIDAWHDAGFRAPPRCQPQPLTFMLNVGLRQAPGYTHHHR